MRAVVYSGAGGNEVVSVQERPDLEPEGDELLVTPIFGGINPADLQQRDGIYPPPPGAPRDVPGLEVAGTVVAQGRGVTDFEIGDRVMGIISGGGLATQVLVPQRHVTRVPDNVDDLAAAAIPEAFVTAHDAIVTQGRLRPGEVLLVSGAAGGVGTAAVQIAVRMGVIVVGLSRSAASRSRIDEIGGIGVDPQDAKAVIDEVSGGRGADVILELVGAPSLRNHFDALATRGRVVVVGVGAGTDFNLDLRRLMGMRAQLIGTVLRARPAEQKGMAVQSFARELIPGFADDSLSAVIDKAFAIDDVHEAFTHMEKDQRFGKTLLRLKE